eukprot:5595454-Amphidinium_carterae.1
MAEKGMMNIKVEAYFEDGDVCTLTSGFYGDMKLTSFEYFRVSEVVPVVLTTPNGVFNYSFDTADMEDGVDLDSLAEVLINMKEHSMFSGG